MAGTHWTVDWHNILHGAASDIKGCCRLNHCRLHQAGLELCSCEMRTPVAMFVCCVLIMANIGGVVYFAADCPQLTAGHQCTGAIGSPHGHHVIAIACVSIMALTSTLSNGLICSGISVLPDKLTHLFVYFELLSV